MTGTPLAPACSPLRVLHVIQGLDIGGAERLVLDLLAAADRARIAASVLTVYEAGAWGTRLRALGVPLFEARKAQRGSLQAFLWMVRTMRRLSPDIVHTHTYSGKYWGRLAAWVSRVPVVVHTEHSLVDRRWRPVQTLFDWWLRGRTAAFVAVSEAAADRIQRVEGVERSKVSVIPNGIDLSTYAPASPRRDRGGNGEVAELISVGSLTEAKNQRALLDALAILNARGYRTRLRLVGDGPLRPALERQKAELGLGNVELLGARDDVPDLLRSADVFVCSSASEAHPLSLLEAMASGLPVVSTAVGGVAEIVEDGRTGLLVPPGSPPALADAVARLLADPASCAMLGEAARQWALSEFDIRRRAAEYAGLYEWLRHGPGPAAGSGLRLAVFTSDVPWGMEESFVLTEIAELGRRVGAILVIPVQPGAALFHGELARHVARHGVRLPVLSLGILAHAAAACLRAPGPVARALVEVVAGSSRWRVLLKNLAVFPKALHVAGLLRQFGAQHIHAHWASVPATMALVASRLTGVPWSFTAHRWDIAENNLLGAKVRSARFARAISLGGREEILGILGERAWPTLLMIHMGTGISGDGSAPRRGAEGEFSFACVASLVEKKGHRYLLEACRLLRERGCRFVCHVVGGGPLREPLEALAHEYGLGEAVRFRGPLPHDEVMGLLRSGAIHLMVLASVETAGGEREGIPVALMEALAHRVPAISTETGEIPELLGDGAGILVKPGDAAGLADAIERVMLDPAGRAALVETGFARVAAEFNLRTVADRLVALMVETGRT